MSKIQAAYESACKVESDIALHLPTLYALAARCTHVTEFGGRGADGSTLAFLAGLEHAQESDGIQRSLVSWDFEPESVRGAFRWHAAGLKVFFQPRCGDSREVETEGTDLIFFDTLHTYEQLADELEQHGRTLGLKHLAFHDTHTYGEHGEDGSTPGLRAAIAGFLEDHRTWKQVYESTKCNGLVILERA